jgi:membrane fusion protein, copper/silver efflux system
VTLQPKDSTMPYAPPSHPSLARRALRVTSLAAIPVAALVVAWWMTRTPPAAPVAGAHNHAAAAAPSSGASPVSLTDDQARRIGVTFAPVTANVLSHEVRTVGQVTVDETRVQTIAPKVDGWVEQLYVDFTGRRIERGEPLMRVYAPMLVTAQEELLLARRLAKDVAGSAADTQADTDDLLTSARRRLAYWDISAEEIASIERSGQIQRTLLLRSSATGVVVQKNVTTGQRIMAGEALFRVADLSIVWVEGDVYEQDLRAIRVGQVAVAEFDAYPGERWTGRIAYVYPTLNTDTRTVRVRVALANPGVRLKPGMYATLRITGATSSNGAAVLTVPRGAVLATGERSLVFVRRADGRLEPRNVTVGLSSGERVEILRGVALGETVVASATFLVDAESKLGTALGGMGNMPGMDMTLPPTDAASKSGATPPIPSTPPAAAPQSMPDMPGMPTPSTPPKRSKSRGPGEG